MGKWKMLIMWGALVVSAAACGTEAAPSQPDQVATQVAVAQAVAATLTADASAITPPATTIATSEPVASATPEPAVTAPRPPTPTNTPEAEAADPFVPGVGNPNGLIGQIVLPGYSGPLDPPLFKDSIVFKLVVYDPAIGNVDGAGIKAVNIQAVDPLGRTIIDQHEGNWAYCAFGNPQNDPKCTVWRFSEHGFKWPNGTPVCAGEGYSVNMTVDADDPQKTGANWNFGFNIESPDGSLPQC